MSCGRPFSRLRLAKCFRQTLRAMTISNLWPSSRVPIDRKRRHDRRSRRPTPPRPSRCATTLEGSGKPLAHAPHRSHPSSLSTINIPNPPLGYRDSDNPKHNDAAASVGVTLIEWAEALQQPQFYSSVFPSRRKSPSVYRSRDSRRDQRASCRDSSLKFRTISPNRSYGLSRREASPRLAAVYGRGFGATRFRTMELITILNRCHRFAMRKSYGFRTYRVLELARLPLTWQAA